MYTEQKETLFFIRCESYMLIIWSLKNMITMVIFFKSPLNTKTDGKEIILKIFRQQQNVMPQN